MIYPGILANNFRGFELRSSRVPLANPAWIVGYIEGYGIRLWDFESIERILKDIGEHGRMLKHIEGIEEL